MTLLLSCFPFCICSLGLKAAALHFCLHNTQISRFGPSLVFLYSAEKPIFSRQPSSLHSYRIPDWICLPEGSTGCFVLAPSFPSWHFWNDTAVLTRDLCFHWYHLHQPGKPHTPTACTNSYMIELTVSHGRGAGARWSFLSLSTQTILMKWFCNFTAVLKQSHRHSYEKNCFKWGITVTWRLRKIYFCCTA